MEYSIQELVANINSANVNRMIPILIGQKKSIYKEPLNFTDDSKVELQLSNINNVIIDKASLIIHFKSWNLKSPIFSISNYLSGTKQIDVNIDLTERLSINTILVFIDNNNNILHSTTVDEFIYNQNQLVRINLTDPYMNNGVFDCCLIALESKNIIGSFDYFSNRLDVDTSFIFLTPSFNTISNSSYISYIGSSKEYSVNYIDKITQDIIDSEQNIGIKAGLILDKSAVVIYFPNDSYIGQLIEDLTKLTIGYYIVPIELSENSIKSIASFVEKSENENLFLMLLINAPLYDKNILTSCIYGEANYVAIGYVANGYFASSNSNVILPTSKYVTDGYVSTGYVI